MRSILSQVRIKFLFVFAIIFAFCHVAYPQEGDTLDQFRDGIDSVANQSPAVDSAGLIMPDNPFRVDTSYFSDESDGFNLILAAEQGDLVAMEILLRRGADVTETTWDGVTALMYAAAAGDVEAVGLLLEHGAEVNKVPDNGMTALIGAVRSGSYEVAELLLENGADPDHTDGDGLNALMYAVAYNYDDIVGLLLFYGADISHRDWFQADALIMGAYSGSFESVRLLIDHGADIETKDKYGFTPLMVASQEGHYDLVWYLIDQGADVTARNLGGYDALCIAVENGRKDIVGLLIENGADVNTNVNGTKNLLDIANSQNDQELVEMLKGKGGRRNFFPYLSAVTGGFEINWNWDDVMIGPGFGLIDGKYGLELYSQFLIRPVMIRVLEEEGENLAWQFYERRYVLDASLNKNIRLVKMGNAQFGITPGLGVGYTWGSFRGSDRKPSPRTVLIPNAGLYYKTEDFVCSFSYQFADMKVNKISPHHFNLSFRYQFDIRNEKYSRKDIPWF